MGIPPAVTEETRAYWEAAKAGRLLVLRCDVCGAESFPLRPMCRSCRSREVSAVEVTATGHVYSYTINHQRWLPNMQVPFVIVLVEFAEHPGVRVPGLLRGVHPAIGMRVQIGFEEGPEGFAVPSFNAEESV